MEQIYLAGSFSRLDKIKGHAQELREKGYMVDCRWLQGLHQVHQGAEKVESTKDSMPPEALLFAKDDIEDLQKADTIICFTERPNSPRSRGGRHVEFGLALAWKKEIFCIGPCENIFYVLPQVTVYKDWESFYQRLRVKKDTKK